MLDSLSTTGIIVGIVFASVIFFLGYLAIVILSPSIITFPPQDAFYTSPADPTSKHALPSLHDIPTLELSIVIPAYNESTRLLPMLQAAFDHLLAPTSPKRSFEIIIVNDGSKDTTEAIALSALSKILSNTPGSSVQQRIHEDDFRVVTLCTNRGKGAAVKKGVLHARGTRILMVDADGASQFKDLELLWKGMDAIQSDNNNSHALVVGSRAHLVDTEAVVKRSFIRNLLMRGLHLCLRTLGVGHIRDTQCGFKLFSRSTARTLFPSLHIAHWIFDVELLLHAHLLVVPVVEIPIAWHEVQGSKINLMSDSIGMLKDLLLLRLNFALGRWNAGSIRSEDNIENSSRLKAD